jgi:hypothetical protein
VVIVSTLLEEDRRKSCEEIAHEANLSTASVFKIVTQTLQKRKVVKWVPHEAEGEQFLNRIVAIDETWIRDFEEPQLKSQCNFSPEKKCRLQQSKIKFVLIMICENDGVIATECLRGPL